RAASAPPAEAAAVVSGWRKGAWAEWPQTHRASQPTRDGPPSGPGGAPPRGVRRAARWRLSIVVACQAANLKWPWSALWPSRSFTVGIPWRLPSRREGLAFLAYTGEPGVGCNTGPGEAGG